MFNLFRRNVQCLLWISNWKWKSGCQILLIKNYENIIAETRMLIKRQTVPINESERTEDMILKSLITRIENPREIVNVESSEVRDSLHWKQVDTILDFPKINNFVRGKLYPVKQLIKRQTIRLSWILIQI